MSTFTASPTSIVGLELIEGTLGRSGTKIKIKPERHSIRVSVGMWDVTGDGDSDDASSADQDPVFEEGMATTYFSVQGWVIGGSTIGLANLGGTSGTLTFRTARQLKSSGTAKIRNVSVGDVDLENDRVAISITGVVQGNLTEALTE